MTPGWTDDRIEQLKTLKGEGLSASQIARALGGVTRNSVISKLYRSGLGGGSMAKRPARSRDVSPAPPKRQERQTDVRCRDDEPEAIGPANDFSAPGTCRWIHGDPKLPVRAFVSLRAVIARWRCCGHPSVPDTNWCEHHLGRMHSRAGLAVAA